MVERRSYNIDSNWIMGYGRPQKDVESKAYRETLDKLIGKKLLVVMDRAGAFDK